MIGITRSTTPPLIRMTNSKLHSHAHDLVRRSLTIG